MKAVVTGASSGFGRALAVEVARSIQEDVTLVLVGRRVWELQVTENMVASVRKELALTPPNITRIGADLNSLKGLEDISTKMFSGLDKFNSTAFFNNAGSLQPLGNVQDSFDLTLLNRNINLNVTSALYLSSKYVSALLNSNIQRAHKAKFHCLVNISSLCAIEPFKSMSVYCAGKAARDMFHMTAAHELCTSTEDFRVLNYAPGPMDTDMHKEIREGKHVDQHLRQAYQNAFDKSELVNPYLSARKCIDILFRNDFESGAHVDYYDI